MSTICDRNLNTNIRDLYLPQGALFSFGCYLLLIFLFSEGLNDLVVGHARGLVFAQDPVVVGGVKVVTKLADGSLTRTNDILPANNIV